MSYQSLVRNALLNVQFISKLDVFVPPFIFCCSIKGLVPICIINGVLNCSVPLLVFPKTINQNSSLIILNTTVYIISVLKIIITKILLNYLLYFVVLYEDFYEKNNGTVQNLSTINATSSIPRMVPLNRLTTTTVGSFILKPIQLL